jgi:cell division protein FtsW (lipid II flippase)
MSLVLIDAGSDRIRQPWVLLVLFAFILFFANLIARFGIGGFVIIPVIAGFVLFLLAAFKHPKWAWLAAVFYGITMAIPDRYILYYTGATQPVALLVDGFLVIGLLGMFFRGFRKADYTQLRNVSMGMIGLWTFYSLMQYFNPEAVSAQAWTYSIRQYFFYILFCFVLVVMAANRKRDFMFYIDFLITIGFIGSFWSIKMKHVGLGPVDNKYLEPKLLTHMLWGQLRVFGMYLDAGTAGAAQAFLSLVAFVTAFHSSGWKKWYYIIAGGFCYYGLAISGTRGSLVIPLTGFIVYLVFSKNVRIILTGAILFSLAIFFLLFTTIGQGNYTISRMRSAFDPDNGSLKYRQEARAAYAAYMNEKPFGRGLGTSGKFGSRFLGDDSVVKGTDGGFVVIHAETGWFGLYMYFFIWGVLLTRAGLMLWNYPDKELRGRGVALLGGILGALAANYGNSVVIQFPLNCIIYSSLGYFEVMRIWQKNKAKDLDGKLITD